MVKNSPGNAGDTGSIPDWGRSHVQLGPVPQLLSLWSRAWEPQLPSPLVATTEALVL